MSESNEIMYDTTADEASQVKPFVVVGSLEAPRIRTDKRQNKGMQSSLRHIERHKHKHKNIVEA